MSADGRSQDVDERGRRAAVALRRSVAGVHPGRDLAQRGTRARPVLAIGVLVAAGAVVAVIAFTVGFGDDDDESTLVTDSPTEVRPMAPTEVPDGLELSEAYGLDASEFEAEPAMESPKMHLYGDPNADDPFGGDDLAVSVMRFPPGDGEGTGLDAAGLLSGMAEGDGAVMAVRGVEGVVKPARTLTPALTVSWVEQEVLVQVASHSLDEDALLEVAEGLDLSDLDAPVPGALPSSLEPLGTGGVGLYGGAGREDGLVGYSLSYSEQMPAAGSGSTSLSIFGFRASAGELLMARWFVAGAARDVEIRGHPGIVSEDESSSRSMPGAVPSPSGGSGVGDGTSTQFVTLIWLEDGVVVQLEARGLDVDEVLAAAESLEPLDDEAWEELLYEGEGKVELGTGELDGEHWALVLEETLQGGFELCVDSSCMGYSRAEEVPTVIGLGDRTSVLDGRLVFGVVGPDVVEVAMLVDGEPYERNHTIMDPDGRPWRYSVVGAPAMDDDEETTYEIVAYDEQGDEIDRMPHQPLPPPVELPGP